MTELEKAARQALRTFEEAVDYVSAPSMERECIEAITALRRALEQDPDLQDKDPELIEQPAQKRPTNCGTGYCSCIECLFEPEQPAPQEPVAIVEIVVPHLESVVVRHILDAPFPRVGDFLYTRPPAREWVGLTDEERTEIVEANTTDDHGYDIWCDGDGVARAIEAKLREKNA